MFFIFFAANNISKAEENSAKENSLMIEARFFLSRLFFSLFGIKNIKFIILIALWTIINQTNLLSSECFRLVPFGYNDYYVKLPSNFKFCVKKKDTKVYYETGFLGERILKDNKNKNSINVFGDSHALGLDVNIISEYFLYKVFPKNNFHIYAAPNNGPYEVLNFLKIHKDTFYNKKGIIIFNLSTDIFRINEKWDPKNFVSLNDFQLEEIKYSKLKYEYYFFKDLFFNKKLKIALPNNNEMLTLFNNDFENIEINFRNYLNDLNILKYESLKVVFVLPYWIYQKNSLDKFEEKKRITSKIYGLVCKNLEIISSKYQVLVQKNDINLNKPFLTIDNRHFRSNLVVLTDAKNLCNNY